MSEDAWATHKLIANERAKLTATYLNGIAIALFAVGGLAPLIAIGNSIRDFDPGLSTGVAHFQINYSGASLLISLVCFGGSAVLHSAARRALRTLRA